MTKSFKLQLAPSELWQAINPWSFYNQGAQFGLVNINLGSTNHPELEAEILEEVGSYGRQLGRIGDALEVLVNHVDRAALTPTEIDCLDMLKGQLAAVRRVKAKA